MCFLLAENEADADKFIWSVATHDDVDIDVEEDEEIDAMPQ